MCRREFHRLSRALNSFDPAKKSWKALALHKWLSEYFLLIVNMFERQKSMFLADRFTSMGYELPSNLRYDDDALHTTIAHISRLSTKVCNLSLARSRLSPRKLLDAASELKQELINFKMTMEAHYSLEENYWPEKLSIEGRDETFLILSKMAMDIRDMEPSIGELCTATILYTAGHMHKVISSPDICDAPWCDPRTCGELLKTLPYVVKVVPFMHQISRVLQYRTMILSLEGVEDSLDLIAQYRQQQVERYLGCGGWVWKPWRGEQNPVKQEFDKNFTSMRITSEMRALSLSASRDEQQSPPSFSRKIKTHGGFRSASLDSFADMDPSFKSSPSPTGSSRGELSPSWKKGFYGSSKVVPTGSAAAAKTAFSPRFLAMVSNSGSTDTIDSALTRSTYGSANLGSSSGPTSHCLGDFH